MTHRAQRGFSLMEMIVVLGILTLLMGIVFTTLSSVQQRNQTETQRVDTTQNSREFMDQIERDLRNLGYPNARMFDPVPATNSPVLAAGMIAASATDIWFEGNIDGSANVTNIRYTLEADANGKCPCTLKRSAIYRSTIGAPSSILHTSATYSGELVGVANSIGGTSPWTLAGSDRAGTLNDTLYATYKNNAIFQYFDKDNNLVPVPDDLSTSSNLSAGSDPAVTSRIAYVVVTVNVLSSLPDQQTGLRAATPMRTSVRLSNL